MSTSKSDSFGYFLGAVFCGGLGYSFYNMQPTGLVAMDALLGVIPIVACIATILILYMAICIAIGKPHLALRKDLISNSMSQFERFIDYFLSDENDMDERKWISKENKEISKNNLFEEYCFWCGRTGETPKPKHILFRNIPKNKLDIDLSKRPRKTINGKRIEYIKFV